MVKSVCLQCGRSGFDPWVGKIPWRRKWQPTPVLLPGKFHGWRSLVGYSPWGCKESDKIEQLHFHFSLDWGFACGSAGKESTCNAGDLGSIPGLGITPGEGKGYPLQYSGLENFMDCSLQGSSIHGIFQARVLEWVAISFSRGSSQPRDQTRVSRITDALPSEPPGS